MPVAEPTIEVHLEAGEWREEIAEAARCSLAADPPYLDPVWFYDDRGSRLFDAITRLPEYYPTRAERALLAAHADEIATCNADTLVELGSGTSDKTTVLLDAMASTGNLERFVPFDVSEETLRHAVDRLDERYDTVMVHGIVGDFHHHLEQIPAGGRRLVAFLGSTIGNLRPNEREQFLSELCAELAAGDRLLLGIDLVKDPSRLIAAYDDAAGVTAEFNRNALRVVNRVLGSDFDADGFDHVATWDSDECWIEMRLRARTAQTVTIPGLPVGLRFEEGEDLRTEISTKFTVEGITDELQICGYGVIQTWIAPHDDFALLLAEPRD